jgi:hypothetical protein
LQLRMCSFRSRLRITAGDIKGQDALAIYIRAAMFGDTALAERLLPEATELELESLTVQDLGDPSTGSSQACESRCRLYLLRYASSAIFALRFRRVLGRHRRMRLI